MAVPKKKTSKSKRNMRRSHDSCTPVQLNVCENCGSSVVPHNVCPRCNHYNGRNVYVAKQKDEEPTEKAK